MPEENIYKAALSKAMNLCSAREYCCSEILSKLESWSIGRTDCERIIKMLVAENFINERRYAEAFTRDKFRYNKWGKVKIAAHLRSKNIPANHISEALETIGHEDYKNTISNLLNAHKKSVKAKNTYELKGKLLRFGLSRGFESSLLYELLNDME
jgi:regulatory protein